MNQHKINDDYRFNLLLKISKGAKSRRDIMKTLHNSTKNCNQISKELDLDWWTIQMHLNLLMQADLIRSLPFGHAKYYRLTELGDTILKQIAAELFGS